MAQSKLERLQTLLCDLESVAVAYSGGVDSTLVLRVAHDALGDRAIALTAISPSLPEHERLEAEAIAQEIGVRHVPLETRETEDPRYIANAPDRCFFCKDEVYGRLVDFARREGYRHLVDGTNADDAGDHRPGRAAARKHGVRSPLEEVGLAKSEVREAARRLGLSNWDKPAAACLASRVPYGSPITEHMLSQVERAESALKRMGFGQLRVRHHDRIARIEVDPAEFESVLARREEIVERLTDIGFAYVSLDLAGFRSGSMNEALSSPRSADGRREAQTAAR